MPQLVKLMDSHPDPTVTSKALYALSCLCRHNNDAIKHLEVTNFLSVILRMLQGPDEKLRAKTAFFLSYLATHENFREAFYQADVVGILLKLLKEEQDSSSEHLLSALQAQVAQHKQSRIQCRKGEYHLKDILEAKIQMYGSKGEYEEAKESCSKILDICFHEEKNS
ncbi:Hsp70-binding protein 1, partial [Stegodyphus mimosarum]